MIKVIHVLSDMKIGGAGSWLLNLLSAIDKDRFEIKVMLPKGSLLIDKVKGLGFEVISVDGMKDRSFDAGAVGIMLDIFRREKPRIVHTHASLSARLAARMAGAKIINTKHCMDSRKTGIKKLAGACLNSFLSDRTTAVSEAVKQNLADNGYPEDKISVIYGGVGNVRELDTEEKNRIKERFGIKPEEIVVGIVARLAEVKGHKYFLDAAEIISRDNINVRFLIAGIGPKEKELRELVSRKGLTDRVIFTGFMENIYEIFNILDINVISSLSEALCLSLVEGMCVGKPAVASDTGGIPEAVKDGYNGYLVPAGDPGRLAEAILKLIRDPGLRKTMGDRGRDMVEGHFTADAMARDIGELYETIINSPRRR
ncbi:MAG: glycosyltransferase [Clostridiaceae bacterium]|jgi:glycosyltransferase involved in cell wall biosynthesis|nr:glycosyltransferase [Clostridiaceae bacterium]